jgi:hypothetical protein
MPSPVGVLTVQLGIAPFSSLSAQLNAPARFGFNNFTLGVPGGFRYDLNFTVIAEGGQVGVARTIRLTQKPPSGNTSWVASVTVQCGFSGMMSSANNPASVTLPSNCAGVLAFVNVTLAQGASAVPPVVSGSMVLGARGSVFSYSFTVKAEDSSSSTYTYQLVVAKLDDISWSARVSGGGLTSPTTLNSSTAASLTVLAVIPGPMAPIALDNSSLSYWLNGDKCALASSSPGSNAGLFSPADSNAPAARTGGFAWTSLDGALFMYAGSRGSSYLSDTWSYSSTHCSMHYFDISIC